MIPWNYWGEGIAPSHVPWVRGPRNARQLMCFRFCSEWNSPVFGDPPHLFLGGVWVKEQSWNLYDMTLSSGIVHIVCLLVSGFGGGNLRSMLYIYIYCIILFYSILLYYILLYYIIFIMYIYIYTYMFFFLNYILWLFRYVSFLIEVRYYGGVRTNLWSVSLDVSL